MQTILDNFSYILDNLSYIVIVVFLLFHEISIRSIRKELNELKNKSKESIDK